MAFSSSTKSWAICGKDQRRECIAHAAFNSLSGLPGEAGGFVKGVQSKLKMKLRDIQDGIKYNREPSADEKALLLLESGVAGLSSDVSGIKLLEKIFPVVQVFSIVEPVGRLGRGDVETFLREQKLSKIVEAIGRFSWTGTSSKAPIGKAESAIGIADDLLEKLLTLSGGDSKLTSWLQSSDAQWKRVVDSEVDRREKQLKQLKSSDPKNAYINALEGEIDRLKKNWAL